jgi:hypothetical protein
LSTSPNSHVARSESSSALSARWKLCRSGISVLEKVRLPPSSLLLCSQADHCSSPFQHCHGLYSGQSLLLNCPPRLLNLVVLRCLSRMN